MCHKVEEYINSEGKKRARVKNPSGHIVIPEVTVYMADKSAQGLDLVDKQNRGRRA